MPYGDMKFSFSQPRSALVGAAGPTLRPALPRHHYNCRGYAPSDVPADPAAYSQEILIADMRALMTALGID
jgi:hypothetical protein